MFIINDVIKRRTSLAGSNFTSLLLLPCNNNNVLRSVFTCEYLHMCLMSRPT